MKKQKQIEFKVRDIPRKNNDLQVVILNKKEFKKLPQRGFRNTNFKAKKNEMIVSNDILFVGSEGIKGTLDWRELGFKIALKVQELKVKGAYIEVPLNSEEFMEGVILGFSPNNLYKSEPEKVKLREFTFIPENENEAEGVFHKLQEAGEKMDAQYITKYLVDLTGEDATSESILEIVEDIFVGSNIDVELYEESFLQEKNMNGHLAVNRASDNPAMTIKLSYKSNWDNPKNIVLVGKGLTYDTGGLSIKPTNSMVNMQADKAGAMTLVGFMDYIRVTGSENNITCYIALAENSIAGNAYRPGDVLTMKNNKTVMIKNTDAEGRLVLFDNLCLAQEQNKKIDEIYSIATLTGSAVAQFGEEAAGMVGFNDKMKKKLKKAGDKQDEIFLDAQFHKYMLDGVKDSIADLSNTGTPYMGCQKAGLFLTHALKKKNKDKFLHIDIAPTAWSDNGFSTYKSGGTGWGVRSLIELIQ